MLSLAYPVSTAAAKKNLERFWLRAFFFPNSLAPRTLTPRQVQAEEDEKARVGDGGPEEEERAVGDELVHRRVEDLSAVTYLPRFPRQGAVEKVEDDDGDHQDHGGEPDRLPGNPGSLGNVVHGDPHEPPGDEEEEPSNGDLVGGHAEIVAEPVDEPGESRWSLVRRGLFLHPNRAFPGDPGPPDEQVVTRSVESATFIGHVPLSAMVTTLPDFPRHGTIGAWNCQESQPVDRFPKALDPFQVRFCRDGFPRFAQYDETLGREDGNAERSQ